jgi:arabinan endo-1,5-alpha-L-arabinosidase
LTRSRLRETDSAYRFDGKDNYIEIMHAPSLNPTEGISLAAWILVRQRGFYPAVVNKGNVGNYDESYALYLIPDGRLGCLLNRDGTSGGRTANESGPTIPLNTWTHVACTYDGETIRTYINGDQVSSKLHTGGIFITSNPVLIGKSERLSSNYPTTFFDGSIDEVEIYSRSLLPEEIRALADVDR